MADCLASRHRYDSIVTDRDCEGVPAGATGGLQGVGWAQEGEHLEVQSKGAHL